MWDKKPKVTNGELAVLIRAIHETLQTHIEEDRETAKEMRSALIGTEDKTGLKGRVALLERTQQTTTWYIRTIWVAFVGAVASFIKWQ